MNKQNNYICLKVFPLLFYVKRILLISGNRLTTLISKIMLGT